MFDLQDSTVLIIEEALLLRITNGCNCDFDRKDFYDSNIDCKDDHELSYSANLEYSNNDGSETASVIAERIVRQAPFSMTVQGMPVTVTSACSDCTTVTATTLSLAAGGGLFVGGFVVAAVLITIITLIIIV